MVAEGWVDNRVHVFCMNPAHTWVYWSQLRVLLLRPMKRMAAFHRFTLDKIRERIESKKWLVWLSTDRPGSVVMATFTGFDMHDDGTKDMRIFLVGGSCLMEHIHDWWNAMKLVARVEQCTRIVGAGRTGWLKVVPEKVESFTLNRFEVAL